MWWKTLAAASPKIASFSTAVLCKTIWTAGWRCCTKNMCTHCTVMSLPIYSYISWFSHHGNFKNNCWSSGTCTWWYMASTSDMKTIFSSQNLVKMSIIWLVKSGPDSNSLLMDLPWNSALQSNTTQILSGLLGVVHSIVRDIPSLPWLWCICIFCIATS